jgi:hypothetical protein
MEMYRLLEGVTYRIGWRELKGVDVFLGKGAQGFLSLKKAMTDLMYRVV